MLTVGLWIVLANWSFPALPVGVVEEDQLKAADASVLWTTMDQRMQIVADPSTEIEPIVRVLYPQDAWGSNDSGAQFMVQLEPADEYLAEYFVRFGKDFQFVKGGKLPGLAGGTSKSGLRRADGSGWSARFMWRQGGQAVLYVYHMKQRQDHGDDFPLNVKFTPGTWHRLVQRVKVNQAGKSDGRIRVWFDGRLTLDLEDLQLRKGSKAPVDRFYFSTFFGGSGARWAPTSDQTIDFGELQTKKLIRK